MIDKQKLLTSIKSWTRIDSTRKLPENVRNSDVEATLSENIVAPNARRIASLHPKASLAACDIVTNYTDIYRDRPSRLNMSVRDYKDAIEKLVKNDLVIRIDLGKIVLHAPTEGLFTALGLKCPYKRKVRNIKHAYLCMVTAQLLKINPLVENAEYEVSIGDSNSTIDAVAYRRDGQMFAYEVTVDCTSNIAANAAKLQNKGFAQVTFVCVSSNVRQGVWAAIRDTGFDPKFRSIIRAILFINLFHQKKQFSYEVNHEPDNV